MNHLTQRFSTFVVAVSGLCVVLAPIASASELLRDKRVLVTGGTGFIGSNLATRLVEAGARVRVLARPGSALRNLKAHASQIEVHWGDIRDSEVVHHAVGGTDLVFHLASVTSVPEGERDPATYAAVNVEGSRNIARANQANGKGHLVFTSSAAVYGNQHVARVGEEHPTEPISNYGKGKLAAERLFLETAARGQQVAIARLFNAVGPRQRRLAPYEFMNHALSTEDPLPLHGDGGQLRDFIHVSDVVDALLLLGARLGTDQAPPHAVYNVARGVETSVRQLAEEVFGVLGKARSLHLNHGTRPGDLQRMIGSSDRLRQLGWKPQFGLQDALRDLATDIAADR